MEETNNTAPEKQDQTPDREIVSNEAIALLKSDNIIAAIQTFTADTKEKELSIEFVKSYVQFLKEIAGLDSSKARERTDVEIRDLVSHVNMMLRKRDEDIFTAMIVNSHRHYHQIKSSASKKKEESEEAGTNH